MSLLFPDTGREDMWFYERLLADQGLEPVAGVDEVGRGCLAGPVVAAAVILPCSLDSEGVRDSKVLSPSERIRLDGIIRERAVAVAVASVDSGEIDSTDILRASLKAMRLAIDSLSVAPGAILVDGNQPVPHPVLQKTVIHGDSLSSSIAAASIVAKVYRDRLMKEFSKKFPEYNFERHKGYATKEHLRALKIYGPCPIHRMSFRGVNSCHEQKSRSDC